MFSNLSLHYFDDLFDNSLLGKPDVNTFSKRESLFRPTYVHSEDDSSDSGNGSPRSNIFTSLSNSPDPIGNWESNIESSVWGSILDDLPDEIFSNEDSTSNSLQGVLNNENNFVLDNMKNNLDNENCLLTMYTKEILNNTDDENHGLHNIKASNGFKSPLIISNDSNDVKNTAQLPLVIKQVNSDFLQNQDMNSDIKIGKTVFIIRSNQVGTSITTPQKNSITLQQINISSPKLVSSQNPNVHNSFGLSKCITSEDEDEQVGILTPTSSMCTNLIIKNTNIKKPCIDDHDYFEEVERDAKSHEKQESMLKLTDEEKRLLELENVILPENFGLTKDEEKVLKKVRRKIKNKQSAMESRRRRKEYVDNLEQRVKDCTDTNLTLKRKVDSLSDENKSLLKQLKELQKYFSTSVQPNHNTKKGTCLAMLVLTFGLLFLPFNQMSGNSLKSSMEPNQADVFRSRTLLHFKKQKDYETFENDAAIPLSDLYNKTHLTSDFKVFSEEVRREIEQLLVEDSGSSRLKTTLDLHMNSIERSHNWDPVNVLEYHQDDVSS